LEVDGDLAVVNAQVRARHCPAVDEDICNGVDDDCDGFIDELTSSFDGIDDDGDGLIDESDEECLPQ
jgi:hypothetical protein